MAEELLNRIIPEYHKEICLMKKLHDDDNHTTHDAAMWEKIAAMRNTMAKDVTEQPSLFTMTREHLQEATLTQLPICSWKWQKLCRN